MKKNKKILGKSQTETHLIMRLLDKHLLHAFVTFLQVKKNVCEDIIFNMVDKVFRVNKNLLKCLCNNLHLQPARDIFIRNIIFILEDLKFVEDNLPFYLCI